MIVYAPLVWHTHIKCALIAIVTIQSKAASKTSLTSALVSDGAIVAIIAQGRIRGIDAAKFFGAAIVGAHIAIVTV